MGAITIGTKVDDWSAGQYIFDRTADAGHDPGPVRIPAQEVDYKVNLFWGGYDKSNGTPNGDIKLLVGLDAPEGTNMQHHPEPGDDDETWRWNGTKELIIPAGEARRFSVAHNTGNGHAGNTYLRIQFIASA
jgi:hypothetical protein